MRGVWVFAKPIIRAIISWIPERDFFMPYIFLDESGQFKKHNHDEYFVVGSFVVGNPRRTEKQFRAWQHTKFPKRMKGQAEIKFADVKVTDILRIRTLKRIAQLDVRIRYLFIHRADIPESSLVKAGELYTNIIGELIEAYLPITDKELRVFCDRRHLKGIRETEFKRLLKARLLPLVPHDTLIQIEMIDSTTNANIQIADWIAGALAKYHEHKPLGAECFRELKDNILGQPIELFKKAP